MTKIEDTDIGLDDADVPDLIGALAERLRDYEFSPRQSLMIAMDMLADALKDPQPDPEAVH